MLEPTGERREPGRTGGRPAALYRFRSPRLEITDEFAVLRQTGTDPARDTAAIIELHRALAAPLQIEGFPLTVGVSIGVATSPDDGRTATNLAVRALETARIAPRGSAAVSTFLNRAADALVRGGRTGIFTPMFYFLARKP